LHSYPHLEMYNLLEFLYNTCPWFTTVELYNNGTMLNLLWLVSVGSQSNRRHCATILKQCMIYIFWSDQFWLLKILVGQLMIENLMIEFFSIFV
jgi:hypothetical protein